MIRITVDSVVSADARGETLARATIDQTSSTTADGGWPLHNYRVRLSQWGGPGSLFREGRLMDFPAGEFSPWEVIPAALLAVLGCRVAACIPMPPDLTAVEAAAIIARNAVAGETCPSAADCLAIADVADTACGLAVRRVAADGFDPVERKLVPWAVQCLQLHHALKAGQTSQ